MANAPRVPMGGLVGDIVGSTGLAASTGASGAIDAVGVGAIVIGEGPGAGHFPAPGARVGGVGRRSVGVIVGSESLAASTGASVAIDVIVTAVQGEVGVTTGGSARPEGRP